MITVSIKTTHIDLTPALRDYTEKRLQAIEKYTGSDASISVEIGKTTDHHKHGDIFVAEVNITTVLGKQYRATSRKSDLYEAIDDVRDELVQVLTSAKGKKEALWKQGARKIKSLLRRIQ